MSNPQGYKNDDVSINKLCQYIYEAFGAYAVINLVNDRQQEGYLKDVSWSDCDGCDYRTPRWDNACLVCGTIMSKPMITINWCPADIALATGLSDERCIEILEQIGKSLHDRSIELGWEVIDCLVQDYIDEGKK